MDVTRKVRYFEGTSFINQLQAFPIANHPNFGELSAQLIARGKVFTSLTGKKYVHHDGIAVKIQGCKPIEINSRVMIDTATFNRREPTQAIKVRGSLKELTEEQLMLCTNSVPVFSFQEKTYVNAMIENISQIVFNERVFDQLVLPQSQKDLVRVLVESHAKFSGFDDFVEGKGKGLITVLHGWALYLNVGRIWLTNPSVPRESERP